MALPVALLARADARAGAPDKVPIGIPLPDMTIDHFMDLEDEPDRFERGLASGAMRDRVWDRSSRSVIKTTHNSEL
jgi:hypothetical protein